MEVRDIFRGLRHPLRAFKYLRKEFGYEALRRIYGPNDGVLILEQDWDNLIVLDACRFDVFEEHCDIDGSLSRVQSRGSQTAMFLQENFEGRPANDTVYVASNAAVGRCKSFLDVHKLVGLWDWEDPETYYGRHPELLVDKTLEMQAEYPNKRLISHFHPPHAPYFVKDGEMLPPKDENKYIWEAWQGEISTQELRSIYEENVDFALEYVAELIDGLEGKTVVTADHGELLGDGPPLYVRLVSDYWGLKRLSYYDIGHYRHVLEPGLIDVPWLEVAGFEDRKDHTSEPSEGEEIENDRIEEHLRALGYKDGEFDDIVD